MPDKAMVNGIAWYRADQWDLLLKVSADRDKLEPTYFDWLSFALDHEKELIKNKIPFHKVEIDINELISWCKTTNKAINGESRAAFVVHKLKLALK